MRAGWVAVVVAACGGSDHQPAASDGPGASIDSPSAPPGAVTVTAIDGAKAVRTPAVNIPIVFIDAAQTQVVMTDANGMASATVMANATVTSIQLQPQRVSLLETVYGVMPGDAIELGRPTDDFSADGDLTVQFAPIAGAQGYEVSGPCGHQLVAASPAILPMMKACATNPVDLVMTPTGAGSPHVISYLATSYAPNGIVMMPAATAPITATIDVANVPAGLTRLSLTTEPAAGGDVVNNPAAGIATLHADNLDVPIATTTIALDDANGAYQYVESRANATSSVDLATTSLPFIGLPSYDMATRTVSTPSSGAGVMPDLFQVYVYTHTSSGMVIQWVLDAAQPGDLVLPALPATLGELDPDPEIISFAAFLLELDTIDGYAAARQRPDGEIQRGLSRAGADQRYVRSVAPN